MQPRVRGRHRRAAFLSEIFQNMTFTKTLAVFAPLSLLTFSGVALAADPPPASTGAPPPDSKALVAAVKAPGDAPSFDKPNDGTNASLSAGGLLTSGNARLLALTVNGAFEMRRDANGFGASVLGNYGQGASPGNAIVATAQNIQGRVRYDRYISEPTSLFLIATGRHDRFQGLDFRLNLDPGVKYLFMKEAANALWGELGYDFQHDIRRDEARIVTDSTTGLVTKVLDKTFSDHAVRAFVGMRHAFNSEVTLYSGLEYLQGLKGVDYGSGDPRSRINFDALFAAKVGGGLSLGVGFGMRWDSNPLPEKKDLDTTTSVSLIYAFSDAPEAPKAPTCPCPPPPPVDAPSPPPAGANPPPPAPPAAAPAPAPAPAAAPAGSLLAPPTTTVTGQGGATVPPPAKQ